MNPRFRRWIAVLLLGALAFAQASVSFASCPMERGTLLREIAIGQAESCELGGMYMTHSAPQNANRCVMLCTADLQLAGLPTALVRSAADAPVLLVPRAEWASAPDTGLEVPPPGTPPLRILLHSFLI